MKKLTSLFAVVIALLLVSTINLSAQSPDLFNYQAIVRDISGNPITNTEVLIELFILQGSSSGTEVYSESHTVTTNGFGLVSLQVGSGTTSGDLATVNWGSGPYFIKVDVDGQQVSVGQMVSVPFSAYSAKAGNVFSGVYNDLTGKPLLGTLAFLNNETDPLFSASAANGISGSNIANWNTAYGWGDHSLESYLTSETDPVFVASPANGISGTNITNWNTAYGWGNHATQGYLKTEVDGSITNELQTLSRSGNTIYLNPSGSSVNLSYMLDSKWLSSSSNIYFNTGNVGVGTSTPKSTLTISGASVTDTAIFEVINNAGQRVFAVYNDGVRILIDETAKGPKGGFAIGGFDGTKGEQEYLRVTKDSTRVYVNQNAKGPKGGFAIGGFDGVKGGINFVSLTPENYFIGHSAGSSITSGSRNFFAGYEAGKSNTSGFYNVFTGYQAGMSNTAGFYNVFTGYQAGMANTDGFYNVFIGFAAGKNNNSASNVFIGTEAGTTNTTGWSNVFIGNKAGYSNIGGGGTYGARNVFIGREAGYENETGGDNIYIGAFSGSDQVSGMGNTNVGIESGARSTSGSYDVYLGQMAGLTNNGDNNVVVGSQAGANGGNYTTNSGFVGSVFIGRSSGYRTTTGDNNTFVGYFSGYSNTTGSGNVFLGYQAGQSETGSNKLYIDNSSTASPLIWGDFSANQVEINGTLTSTGSLTSVGGVIVGSGTGSSDIWLDGNSSLLELAFYEVGTYKGAVGWDVANDNIYMYVGGNALKAKGGRVLINSSGTVGTTYSLQVVGAMAAGSYATVSDARYKREVTQIQNSLEKVMGLNGVYYYWDIGQFPDNNFNDDRQVGFIAQEVEKILPEVVKYDDWGYGSVDYSKVVSVIVEAMKEQQIMIENQKTTIETLLKRVEALENR